MTRPRIMFLLLAITVGAVGIVFKDVAAASIATLVFMVFLESDYSQRTERQMEIVAMMLENMLEDIDEEISNRERSGGP